jgi:hypothetical protein
LAGACLAIAVFTKPQAVLIAPAFALALDAVGAGNSAFVFVNPNVEAARPASRARVRAQLNRRARAWLTTTAAAVATTLAIIAPYVWVGAIPNMWLAFGSFTTRRDILSGQAANVWWIANYLSRALDMAPGLGWRAFVVPVARVMATSTFMSQGIPDPGPYGRLAVLALWAWALWRMRHATDLGRHLLCAAFLVHAFFVLAVGVHENHQILMVPLLALAAVLRPRVRALFVVISTICALNLNLFYGISRGQGWAVPRTMTVIDATVVLSVINILALIWHARLLARESQPAANTAAARASIAASVV